MRVADAGHTSFPRPMDTPLYKTCDPYLASFLLYQKAVLDGGTRLGPKKVEFRFRADERLHQLLRLYSSNEPVGLIPSRLMGCLRTLKSRSFTRG